MFACILVLFLCAFCVAFLITGSISSGGYVNICEPAHYRLEPLWFFYTGLKVSVSLWERMYQPYADKLFNIPLSFFPEEKKWNFSATWNFLMILKKLGIEDSHFKCLMGSIWKLWGKFLHLPCRVWNCLQSHEHFCKDVIINIRKL